MVESAARRLASSPSLDGWLGALEAVASIPEGLEDQRVGRAEALRLLRCEERVLDALVDGGLACVGGAAEQSFGYCDIMNIGLYSQSQRSVAELAESFLVRFARAPAHSLLEGRSWRLQLVGECGRGECCGGGAWRLRAPAPELYGGKGTAWSRLAPHGRAGPGSGMGSVRAELRVRTLGAHGSVRSSTVIDLYRDALERIARHEWRFQYLPRRLRSDPELAAGTGAMDCMSTSLLLASRCRQAGIQARTRKGYILAVNGIEHVWLEVLDEDGIYKAVDPMLAALALRHAATNSQIATFMLGSFSSRLLPWEADAHTELFAHHCEAAPRQGDHEVRPTIALSAAADEHS